MYNLEFKHIVAVFGQNSPRFLVENDLDTINNCVDCTIVKEQRKISSRITYCLIEKRISVL